MPLFGSKHKHDKAAAAEDHHNMAPAGTGMTGHGATGAGMTGSGKDVYPGGTGAGQMQGQGYNAQPGMGHHQGAAGMQGGQYETGQHGTGAMGTHHGGVNDQYGATGAGHNGQAGIPPSAALNTKGGHGGGHSTTGKIERGMGELLGSESLRAKGVQKEQEAQAIGVQSRELAEAERLEREATMRRERAVAHGAHPENKHLGGHSAGGTHNGPGAYN